MDSLKFYFEFYKSSMLLNWTLSIVFAFLLTPSFLGGLPLMLMTAGPLLSLFYKTLGNKQEHFFYYNRGISTPELFLSYFGLSIATGIALSFIISLCQTFLK